MGCQPSVPAGHDPNHSRAKLCDKCLRCLDKQPLADTLTELQTQVDAFDHIYNTERPHQGLPGRVTPQQAWDTTETAESPRPKTEPPLLVPAVARRFRPAPTDLPTGTSTKRLTSNGTFRLAGVTYMVDGKYGFDHVLIITDGDTITVTDLNGEILIEHTRPAPGIKYVGNGRPRGGRPNT